MSVDVIRKNPMGGKIVKFAIGSKESLMESKKILQKVEIYIDGESGTLYIVPEDDNVLNSEFQFKITE